MTFLKHWTANLLDTIKIIYKVSFFDNKISDLILYKWNGLCLIIENLSKISELILKIDQKLGY